METKNKLFVFVVLSLIGILSLASPVLAHAGEDDYSHHGMMGGMMGGTYGYGFMWIFGWVFMILIIVALILFIVWLIKQIQDDRPRRR
jgi:uncharacterized membrane protein